MTCSVVVVYEDTPRQQAAVSFCDELMQRFWAQAGFDVKWWSIEHLGKPAKAREAATQARAADMLVFALQLHGELPIAIRQWVETWVPERNDREGILVDLPGVEAAEAEMAGAHPWLRELAHRAGMDYLTHLPQDLVQGIPDSFDSVCARADQVTGVLDEILHHAEKPHPPVAKHEALFR
jgi:hypothetical protein